MQNRIEVFFAPPDGAVHLQVYRNAGDSPGSGFQWVGEVELQWNQDKTQWSILQERVAGNSYSFGTLRPDINSSAYVVFRDTAVQEYQEYAYLVTPGGGYSGNPLDYTVAEAFPPGEIVHGSYLELARSCTICHGLHSGSSGQKLVKAATVTDICLTCHDGTVSKFDVLQGLVYMNNARSLSAASPGGGFGTAGDPRPYAHDVHGSNPGFACSTCHDPHNRQGNFRSLRGRIDPGVFGGGPPGPPGLSIRGRGQVDLNQKRALTTFLWGGDRFCLQCHNATNAGNSSIFPVSGFTSTRLGWDKFGNSVTGGWCGGGVSDPNQPCNTPAAHLQAIGTASGTDWSGPCQRCHTSHGNTIVGMIRDPDPGAGLGPQANLCTTGCHDGTPGGGADIRAALGLPYRHADTSGQHKPDEALAAGAGATHAACSDCHEPHASVSGSREGAVSGASFVVRDGGSLSLVTSSGGSPTEEFGVCYKCHSGYASVRPGAGVDIALQFGPAAVSYHPVETQGANISIREGAFTNGWGAASRTGCSDCHRGPTARGPHGSANAGLLAAPYPLTGPMTGQELCFGCHNSVVYTVYDDAVLPMSRFFGAVTSEGGTVSLHVYHSGGPDSTPQGLGFSCSVCHDSHGSQLPRLINLSPDRITGFVFDQQAGNFQCTAACHNGAQMQSWTPAY